MEKRVLFLAPGMDGPAGGRYNTAWPAELERQINQNRWRVVTPALLLLAAVAESEGWTAQVVDEEFRAVNWEEHYDLVCMYTVTPNVRRAYRYAGRFRQVGTWVAFGGVHAAMRPEESERFADTLLLGEGEDIFRSFLRHLEQGVPQPRYVQRKLVDLTRSPTPLYRLLQGEEQRLIPMQTSRGCPRGCRFCNVRSLYGDGFRQKTADQMERELSAIDALPRRGRIYITNDNLMGSPEHFKILCSVLRPSGRTWYANADISFGEEEPLIRSAYRSGLRQVLIGLEGVSESGLMGVDPANFKLRHLSHYREYIERIQSNGIGVTGSFIVGGWNDTPETFERLAEFIETVHLYAASVTVSTPYPGTELYRRMDCQGKILSYDWNDYTIFQPVVPGECMSVEEINCRYRQLLERVYSPAVQREKMRYFHQITRRIRN